MNTCKRGIAILSTAFIAAIGLGCGGGDGGSGGARDGGRVAMTVTGAVEGDFEGHATYTDASLELGQFSLNLTDSRNFAMDISMRVDDNAPPPVGTYTIGNRLSGDSFHATFREFEDGSFMNATEFSTVDADAGTLEITSSSDETVEASFVFEARNEADGTQVQITEGTFRAVQVRGGGR